MTTMRSGSVSPLVPAPRTIFCQHCMTYTAIRLEHNDQVPTCDCGFVAVHGQCVVYDLFMHRMLSDTIEGVSR
jgi:hypothetical protein